MDAPPPFWNARRAFVAGCDTSFGCTLAALLVAKEAAVTASVGPCVDPNSPFINERLFETLAVVRGDAHDRTAMTLALSVHEVEVVILAASYPALTVHSLISAARKAVPMAAVVVVVPSLVSRVVAVAEAFRASGGNPVGVVCIPELAPAESAAEFLIAHAERVIRREPAALRGVAAFPMVRRLAA